MPAICLGTDIEHANMQIVPFMHRLSQVFTTTPRQGAIILRRSQVPVYVGTGGKRSQDITHHSPPHLQTLDRITMGHISGQHDHELSVQLARSNP